MKSILIFQPRGLGDILFSQKIAKELITNGFEVFWFTDTYYWLNDYILYDNLKFVNTPIICDYTLLLQNSIEENHPYDIMTCKYKMIGKTLQQLPSNLHDISFDDWKDYFTFKRNHDKENQLYYNILGLSDDDNYILYNSKFGVNQTIESVENNIKDKNIKKIDIGFIDGFTLFDWSKVIENAKEIHTVDTSIMYLVEILNTEKSLLFLYPRHPEHTKKCLYKILKKEWLWI